MAAFNRGWACYCVAAYLAVGSFAASEKIAGFETTYEVLTAGSGDVVGKKDTVTVHATGAIAESGRQFWSTKDDGQEEFVYQVRARKPTGAFGFFLQNFRKAWLENANVFRESAAESSKRTQADPQFA
jgi:hypothetical protein